MSHDGATNDPSKFCLGPDHRNLSWTDRRACGSLVDPELEIQRERRLLKGLNVDLEVLLMTSFALNCLGPFFCYSQFLNTGVSGHIQMLPVSRSQRNLVLILRFEPQFSRSTLA